MRYAGRDDVPERAFSLRDAFRCRSYARVLLLFAFALMSKPMAVSLPVILIALDWYPLARFGSPARTRAVLIEKVPFLLLSIAVFILAGLGVAYGVRYLASPRRWRASTVFLGIALMAVVLGLLVMITHLQILVWRTSVSLWTAVLDGAPESAKPYHQRGNAYRALGRYSDAFGTSRRHCGCEATTRIASMTAASYMRN